MQYLKYLLSKIYQGRKKARAGFTLIELLLSSVLGSMILGTIMISYVAGINSVKLGMASAEINSDGRLAMDHIVRDVRSAIEVETGHDSYNSGAQELVIKTHSIDLSGDVIPGIYDHIVYALDSLDTTQLRKIVYPGADAANRRNGQDPDHVIAENISQYLLIYTGSPPLTSAVEINLTIDKEPLKNKKVIQNINSAVELRNQ